MATRPTVDSLEWATSGSRLEPDAGARANGVEPGDPWPAEWANYTLGYLSDWLTYWAETVLVIEPVPLNLFFSDTSADQEVTSDGTYVARPSLGSEGVFFDITPFLITPGQQRGLLYIQVHTDQDNLADQCIVGLEEWSLPASGPVTAAVPGWTATRTGTTGFDNFLVDDGGAAYNWPGVGTDYVRSVVSITLDNSVGAADVKLYGLHLGISRGRIE